MKNKKITWILALLAVACLAAAMVPSEAQAQELDLCYDIMKFSPPESHPAAAGDFDGDGLSNLVECSEVVYLDLTSIQSCVDPSVPDPQLARAACYDLALRVGTLDPETKDLFVILLPAAEASHIWDYMNNDWKFNPLEFVNNPTEIGGLGVTTHLISQDSYRPDGSIEPGQANFAREFTAEPGCMTKAVKMQESLSYNTVNGVTTVGTPLDPDDTTVWTQVIVDLVLSEPLNLEPSEVWTEYIKHTFAHECGHTLTEYEPPSRKDGSHLPGGTEWIMERFVAYKYSKKDEYTTFYTGTVFTPETQAGIEFYPQ